MTDHYLKEIKSSPLDVRSDIARNGMNALYLPIIAYKDYAEGDYETARVGLETSLKLLGDLYQNGFSESVLAIIDQCANLFRVHIAANKIEKAVEVAVDLLNYIYLAKRSPEYMNCDLNEVLTSDDHWSLVNLYTDIIIIKILGTRKRDVIDLFFGSLLEGRNNWLPHDLKQGGEILARLQSGKENRDDVLLSGDYSGILRLPFSLAYIILSALRRQWDGRLNTKAAVVIDNYLSGLPVHKAMSENSWHI